MTSSPPPHSHHVLIWDPREDALALPSRRLGDFDADAINEAGCVIVTKGALDRVSRGALGRRRVLGAGAEFKLRKAPLAEQFPRFANLTEKRGGSREG